MATNKLFQVQIKDGTIKNAEVKLDAGIEISKLEGILKDSILIGGNDGTIVAAREIRWSPPIEFPNDNRTQFTTDYTPINGTVKVALNGLLESITKDYTVNYSAKRITFTNPPLASDKILIKYITNDIEVPIDTEVMFPGDSIFVQENTTYTVPEPTLAMENGSVVYVPQASTLLITN